MMRMTQLVLFPIYSVFWQIVKKDCWGTAVASMPVSRRLKRSVLVMVLGHQRTYKLLLLSRLIPLNIGFLIYLLVVYHHSVLGVIEITCTDLLLATYT